MPRARGDGHLAEVGLVFAKLGVIGFGGPAAHVALMRRETVVRRQWLDEERFLELFGAANLIPGPSSTELGMMLGFLRAGWTGLVVAGAAFITPALVIVLALSWAYVRFGSLPQTGWLLYGVKAVVVAIVADALWRLGRRLSSMWLVAVSVVVLALYLAGVDVLALLFGGALLVAVASGVGGRRSGTGAIVPLVSLGVVASSDPSLLRVFGAFLKFGAVVFGSGYVLFAFLRGDLVQQLHWLSEQQVVDAIAVGQVTPGPVFTTAAFVGYLLHGVPGALVATLGIFLPGFVLAAVVYGQLGRARRSPTAKAFLDGATASGLGLMAGVTVQLGRVAVTDWLTALIAVLSFAALLRFEINPVWLIVAGGALGLTARGLGL
jgi:chromate transporter